MNFDSTRSNWYTKVKPLYTNFIKGNIARLEPRKNISIDESEILFKSGF